jgi:hypothetical protein
MIYSGGNTGNEVKNSWCFFKKREDMKFQLVVLALSVSIVVSAQQTTDITTAGRINSAPTLGDTATLMIEKQLLQDLSQEQKNTIMMILRHGTASPHGKDPFLLPSDYYAIIRPPDDPYRNNIDHLLKSIEANMKKYYEQGHIANGIGETLNYLSFLLIFL